MAIVYYENYDFRRGWADTKPGWYNVDLPRFNANVVLPINFIEILDWLRENIDNCDRHARWYIGEEYMSFKFRYEKDYLHFMLRWG